MMEEKRIYAAVTAHAVSERKSGMRKSIGIPLAAGVWYPIFGWKLNPMFGAAAMSLSSFCVVLNALRLNLFDVHSTKRV